jgi:hypothetical protein
MAFEPDGTVNAPAPGSVAAANIISVIAVITVCGALGATVGLLGACQIAARVFGRTAGRSVRKPTTDI